MKSHEVWLYECQKIDFEPKIKTYSEGTRSSEDAATQLGCHISRIAKSIVFCGKDCAVVVVTSGINRVDRKKKLKKILGYKPSHASPEYIINNTGYAIGGVPPFGHLKKTFVLMDEDLLNHNLVWGAAGSSETVFPISPAKLKELSGAKIVDIKQK